MSEKEKETVSSTASPIRYPDLGERWPDFENIDEAFWDSQSDLIYKRVDGLMCVERKSKRPKMPLP